MHYYFNIFNIISLFYLSLIVTLIMGINESDNVKKIVQATLRRWTKMLGALFVIMVVVHLLTQI